MIVESWYLTLQAFALAVGACMGSFANVCVYRIPRDLSVVSPGSQCISCGHAVRPWDNIPVLSWLLLRGQCRDCGARFSSLYPTVEALLGLLSWRLFVQLVPSAGDVDLVHGLAWCSGLLFIFMLVTQALIDLRYHIIPDEFSVYAIPLGLGSAALLAHLGYPEAIGWKQSVMGALLGGGTLAAVMGAYWLIRREEGMGLGDVKLLAMIGAFLGAVPALPFVLLVASVIGAAIGLGLVARHGQSLRTALPFGPFLALAAVLYVLHGNTLVNTFLPGLAWTARTWTP
ncbi:MAG: prepilin peptidase [Myxococcota bacterium]|nr:prepilin peptidase [Myxococcota bacterium]